ncbi:unnamed protein product [marine sediment metagenome]|uniref:Uncharacterized protein n=1 Tax=marine sediment metagenome TaxID=412755 RepID=X1BMS6_9ZZZZ
MQKKTYIYFILSVIGFFFLLTIPDTIAVSDTIVLEYNEEEAVKINPKRKVDWSFTGTNQNVNITLHSYSESCYLADSWHRIVSEGHDSDSGSWSVQMHSVCDPSEQENTPPFYFVFLNRDPDQETTTVTYTLDVDPSPSIPGYNGIIIISSLAMVAIVALKRYTKTK